MGTNRKEKKSNERDEPNQTSRIGKRNPNPRKRKGTVEKGLPTGGPAVPSSPPAISMADAREELEAPTGQVTPPRGSASGSGVKGTAAQPFDGGALTLGWTHAPTKGRAAAPALPPAAMAAACACVKSGGRRTEWGLGLWDSGWRPVLSLRD